MENQISHQNAQTSAKKLCLKAEKKKPTVHTVYNRNRKEKVMNKGTESSDMVCVLWLFVMFYILSLSYLILLLNEESTEK